jgi:hypothetical protein
VTLPRRVRVAKQPMLYFGFISSSGATTFDGNMHGVGTLYGPRYAAASSMPGTVSMVGLSVDTAISTPAVMWLSPLGAVLLPAS